MLRAPISLVCAYLLAGIHIASVAPAAENDALALRLRYQQETSPSSGRHHQLYRNEQWDTGKTAIIVCDVWDYHHCLNAVRRLEQFAPRLNDVLKDARRRGVVVIHAPSDCMPAYQDHPARRRAVQVPRSASLPAQIETWCSLISNEERAVYPIDQSDGGEDDDPAEHQVWQEKLRKLGRNPSMPWKQQSSLIEIDGERDYISDKGDEVWRILAHHGIENVILTGVHTNMCVLGRPFGLRQMVRGGKRVVLMRDMTDTMYNPRRWPYVSHFTGTDLIVSHIERYVCPTITSNQLIGGKPFRFSGDTRPHLVIIMAEDEYETNQSLPRFAASALGREFRISFVHGNDTVRNDLPGLDVLATADVALFSIRRRVLPADQMELIRSFVASGKPVVGIRTASHAFSLRNAKAPDGFLDWPEFDAQVFGGNYHNHHGNKLKSIVAVHPAAAGHPILTGLPSGTWPQGGSLYITSPLAPGAKHLLTGTVKGLPSEAVAWTFMRADGGRSFYTSMGHVDDFRDERFVQLLANGIRWSVGRSAKGRDTQPADHWTVVTVPTSRDQLVATLSSVGGLRESASQDDGWFRCSVRLPASWQARRPYLQCHGGTKPKAVWVNGKPLAGSGGRYVLPKDVFTYNDANLIVINTGAGALAHPPVVVGGDRRLSLNGRWQARVGSDQTWSNMPLPAKFGTATDIVFETK